MKPIKWILTTLLVLLAAGSLTPLPAVDEQRQAYDKMVEEATREADEYVQEKQQKTENAKVKAQSQDDAAFNERVQAEHARIIAEMDTVQGRGLSTTFTQGMKDNRLKELQDQLNRLNSDPQAYFQGL